MGEPEARTTIVGSAVEFRLDYEQTKQFPAGKVVHSDIISAGGHLWGIECYPRGLDEKANQGNYLSIFLRRRSKSRNTTAIFEVFLMGRDGKPCTEIETERIVGSFNNNGAHGDVSKRAKTTRSVPLTAMAGSGFLKFRADYENNKDLPVGEGVHSDVVSAGGHLWRIECYPNGIGTLAGGELSLFFKHMSKSGTGRVEGIFEAFLMDRDGVPSTTAVGRTDVFKLAGNASGKCDNRGWIWFVKRADLEENYVKDGHITFRQKCRPSITLHDITPAAFRVMLQFIYTDALPGEDELGDSPVEMFQDLLAVADRYALDRLKLMCAQKLWDNLSVDTVATTLAFAETYNCQELKDICFDFFAVEKNFKEAVFTDGFALLVQKYPCICAELKEKVRTYA
ncbi:hypothetical protein ACQ4PT_063084 [Festuca glaucescens]